MYRYSTLVSVIVLLLAGFLHAEESPALPALRFQILEQPLTLETLKGTCTLEAGHTYHIHNDFTCEQVEEPKPQCEPSSLMRVLRNILASEHAFHVPGSSQDPAALVQALAAIEAREQLLAEARKVVEECQ